MEETKKKSKKKIGLFIVIGIVVALAVASIIYVSDYYKADDTAMAVSSGQILDESVVLVQGNDMLAFIPEDVVVGLIFYPGGKVQYEAYAPLMEKLAAKGILCVLPHMTGNLAFLESNAADKIIKMYPEIEEWYIGGHSLGGIAASGYAAKNSDKLKGIIFLASYPLSDLSQTSLRALTVRGELDEVVVPEDYDKSKAKLPKDSVEVTIKGGDHANFGNYVVKEGDSTATISREEQQAQIVDAIVKFINN